MSDFDEQPSLGDRTDDEIADFLEILGDYGGAQELRDAGVRPQGLARLLGKPWIHTAHVFGFIDGAKADEARVPIVPASEAECDPSLIGSQIKVTLDAFQIAEYPGSGQHTVLFDFKGRDQAGDEAQDLQYASVLTINDHDRAAVNGVPIFTGLTVPPDGLSFKAKTILVASKGDQALIDALQSAVFQDGLKLMGKLQPALPQLVSLVGGITQNLLKRRKNEQIQIFDLGLDFSGSRTSARLRRGSYVVVQVPGASMWRWDSWSFDQHTMSVVDANGEPAPYNTIVFGVTHSGSSETRSAVREEGRVALEAASPAT
ncbi:hypothetical protein [Acuticoccus yangtzensis]|uniref:hypothetical protein n=1 Tax=Acuticoccus yangtzensis TaxID=1443441 RepID=UPI0009496B70|nr:hypothetical protein [Acuticoccus yangtzensis]